MPGLPGRLCGKRGEQKVMQLCSWVPGRRLREMARVFPTGGLFQLLGWIRRKSLAGIPGLLQELKEEKTPGAIRSHLANTRGAGENTGDRRSGCAGVGVSRRKQWLTARLCLSKGGDASSGVRAKNMPLHLGDTGWKPAGTPCARSAPPATPASLTAGTNTSSRSPRLKHRHVHPPWPPLPLVPPAQAPSEKAPLTPEPAGPALCQGLEAAPPG
ncbi:uncharacterized protein LOC122154674 isoform X2 [Tyto alba]|uniref:uncharacterized protein LOC122153135 isoform X2 n=1 Tax=Tyto alba TaxID=56313 RepID=UPI001C67AA2C|nr:uncharacterized protein LOC122153135 isoform X2 [Tyto alba]XP_042660954.1 uncharacterized protein LOC122154670 isoform X2 [Tyto alba]XP_042660961.1 uncharacterized protein LOC122154674 isoform X2 [Tyto alba]